MKILFVRDCVWLCFLVLAAPVQGSWLAKCGKYLRSLAKHSGNPVAYYDEARPIAFTKDGITADVGRIRKGANQRLNAIIDEVESVGGIVISRRLVASVKFLGSWRSHPLSQFGVDLTNGLPTLALDPRAPPHEIEHELQHFHDWLRIRGEFMESGAIAFEAGIDSFRYWSIPKNLVEFEENAVRRELEVSKLPESNASYVARIVYPQIAGILRFEEIREATRPDSQFDRATNMQVEQMIKAAIEKAAAKRPILVRKRKFSVLLDQMDLPHGLRPAFEREMFKWAQLGSNQQPPD